MAYVNDTFWKRHIEELRQNWKYKRWPETFSSLETNKYKNPIRPTLYLMIGMMEDSSINQGISMRSTLIVELRYTYLIR